MSRMRLLVAMVVALAALAPQTVGAKGEPVRFPGGALVGTLQAGRFCPFPVYTQPVPIDRTQTVTLFFDAAGNVTRITSTGAQDILLQNASTGRSIVVNASGMGTLIPQADGSLLGSGGGPGLFAISAVEGGPVVHGPGIFLIEGRVSFTITPPDQTGQTLVENLVVKGAVTNMCDVLAT